MDHQVDPKEDIINKLGSLDHFELFNNQVLVAVYKRPEKTKSGLYLTENTRSDDRYQSKVGLIVKMGPSAFEDNEEGWFQDTEFNLHDWIVYRPSDGWEITLGDQPIICRILIDTQIRARVNHPDQIW